MVPARIGQRNFSAACVAEIGHHHHISGDSLLRYAQEATWREDNRRVSNSDQVQRLAGLAMKRGKSVDLTGYWQRALNHKVVENSAFPTK